MRSLKINKVSQGYDTKGDRREGLILQRTYTCSLVGLDAPLTNEQKKSLSFRANNKAIREGELRIDFPKNKKEAYSFDFQITVVSPLFQGHTLSLEIVFGKTTNQRADKANQDIGEIESIKINLWIHYAFRWFKHPQLVNEIAARKAYPWKISQRSTSLCGIACLFYFLIQDDPDAYERIILRLHQYGYSHHNNYLILPNAYLYSIDPDRNPQYPQGMASVDWISLASVRNMESRFGYRGKADQVASAINWPHILIKLGRDLLGYGDTKFKLFSPVKTYIRDYLKNNTKLKILAEEVEKSHREGARLILLVDSDMLHNRSHYHLNNFIQYHWVAYEGGLQLMDKNGLPTHDYAAVEHLRFDIFSWGEEIKHSRTSGGISRNAFIRNYYGYIRMR